MTWPESFLWSIVAISCGFVLYKLLDYMIVYHPPPPPSPKINLPPESGRWETTHHKPEKNDEQSD